MTKRLRNIFDQYDLKENHLTNSLMLVLRHNRNLLRNILKSNNIKMSGKQLNLLSQVAPKRSKNKESIPDGYIYTEDYGFCVGIETKIKSRALRKRQLIGHLNQLSAYDQSYLLVLTPDENPPKVLHDLQQIHSNLRFISWLDLIKIMSEKGPDKGKNPIGKFVFGEFMSFMERNYFVTPFTGFNFRDGYDADLAAHYIKRISKAITPDMRKLYPECRFTRPKIGKGGGYPWESWYPTEKIQNSVHFTLSVQAECVLCLLIMANGCREAWQYLKSVLDSEKSKNEFKRTIKQIYKSAPKGAKTRVSIRQRHFIGQSVGINDAVSELNIAMLLGLDGSKPNEIWWNLLNEVAKTKNKYNYQFDIAYKLPYDKIPALKTVKAKSILLKCFEDLKPAYKFITNK